MTVRLKHLISWIMNLILKLPVISMGTMRNNHILIIYTVLCLFICIYFVTLSAIS